MILGMSTATFTLLHVIISLVGIGSGLAVVYGFLQRKIYGAMTAVFLVTTALTSLTGYAFPFEHLLPSHIIGALSLVVLAIAALALYVFHLAGGWRRGFVVASAIALYFNCFVLVAQMFMKVGPLHALAPTQKEPPFAVAQFLVLAVFVGLTVVAAKRFPPQSAH
jgi:hypothetical protein